MARRAAAPPRVARALVSLGAALLLARPAAGYAVDAAMRASDVMRAWPAPALDYFGSSHVGRWTWGPGPVSSRSNLAGTLYSGACSRAVTAVASVAPRSREDERRGGGDGRTLASGLRALEVVESAAPVHLARLDVRVRLRLPRRPRAD